MARFARVTVLTSKTDFEDGDFCGALVCVSKSDSRLFLGPKLYSITNFQYILKIFSEFFWITMRDVTNVQNALKVYKKNE